MKAISLIIRPALDDEAGPERTAVRVVAPEGGEREGAGSLKGPAGAPAGGGGEPDGLTRTKVEVVVPRDKADEILKTIVETIYATPPEVPPADSLASFEALLEEHMAQVVRWMEGAGDGRLHAGVIRMVERSLLKAVLRRTKGNQLQAARALGINRNTLRGKLKEMKLKPGRPQGGARRRATIGREPSSPDVSRLNVGAG